MLIFQPFKVVTYSFAQLIKGNAKGVTLKVSVIVVKYQAAQYGRIGLAKLLFRNIGLLIKVYKDNQFKIKIIIFIAVLRFISIELSQVSQLLTVGLYLGRLWIYNLNNGGKVLVHILVYRGIIVHNLGIGCTLAHKINFKGTQIYKINLVKQVRYKASNPIKFKRSKEFISGFNID